MLCVGVSELRLGCEVVVDCNSLPAINDITAAELRRCVARPGFVMVWCLCGWNDV